MDTSAQLYESEATGWKRGLYEDVKGTFRAPFVNWIFRTAMANEPALLRYAWGQVNPVFGTRAFGEFATAYRDEILSVDTEFDLPSYRRETLGVRPPEYRELRGQLATFDVVAPRLLVLFELMDRALHDEPVGVEPDESRSATEPLPSWLDRGRGAPPTMVGADDVPDQLDDTLDSLRRYHGLDDSLPSIYRCLAQWPEYLSTAWRDLEPVLESEAFADARAGGDERVGAFVDATPYRPRLDSETLRKLGFESESIEGMQSLFAGFNDDPVRSVVATLPVWAATVDAGGERTLH
ncbi:halocarboxylic acid dehydrogenase DehI family protein [Haloprofundus salilacus]|uniref:halocarboxylic acid dehydrogenase DehI family protein n=1 Tax=Haloprofundus salilacus TaxID=2876190 RepID=UPI001CCF9421|nr:halocarboxylic acid dehydrogenase DehI family protein [Haloprofundus salilacus]